MTSPRIGIDQQNLYITADQFSIQGPQFDGGELWVIDKAGLVAGKPTVKFAHFGGLTIAGQTTLAPQPALSTVKPHAEFMLSQLDFNNQGDNRLGVWAITDRAAGRLGRAADRVQRRHQVRAVRQPAAGAAEGLHEHAEPGRRPDAADRSSPTTRSGAN